MVDIRIREGGNISEQIWDWFIRPDHLLDETEELATSVRVALGTDKMSDQDDILPDPDSTDRHGWWGDMDAQSIWDGWPIGTKNWLLTRSKITESPSEEGDTIERARQYTLEALQPFIDKGVASAVEVDAKRTELERIEVTATIYRGPLPEIDLRFALLWSEE